jgi:hypothetical protein
MKEEFQQKLLEILTSMQERTGQAIDAGIGAAGKVGDAVVKAGDFAMEQLPDIAQTYIAFERAWSTFSALMWWSLFALFAWLLVVKVVKNDTWMEKDTGYSRNRDWPVERSFAMIASAIATAASFFIAFYHTKDALFVWIAPKVWLLQEIATLIRSMK